MPSINHITSADQYPGILGDSKYSIIDFHANWCGPCHIIAPAYEALSKKYKSVSFFKCDVDQVSTLAKQFQVTAMPTFILLKGTKQVDQVRGADQPSIERALKKMLGIAEPAAFSGKGQTLRESPTMATPVISYPLAQVDPQIKLLLLLFAIYVGIWLYKQ